MFMLIGTAISFDHNIAAVVLSLILYRIIVQREDEPMVA